VRTPGARWAPEGRRICGGRGGAVWPPTPPRRPDDHAPERTGHRTADDTAPRPPPAELRLARFMLDLQADDYDADGAMREVAWADDGVRGFWLGQAGAVISLVGLEACA
jgi:hypothetical protein